MSTAPESRKLTAQEYLAIERASETKHEFYRGEMTAMSGVRVPHVWIVANLMRHLGNALDGSPCKPLSNDLRVLVDPIGFYCYPDIVIVCGAPQLLDNEFDTLLNPNTIIEVLSESTESYDRGEKFRRYRAIESLRTYILVSQHAMAVEWFVRNPPDADAAWSFDSAIGPDAMLPIRTLAVPVAIALRDIYAGVEFSAPNSNG
jgi:Uma2 family endonuclease